MWSGCGTSCLRTKDCVFKELRKRNLMLAGHERCFFLSHASLQDEIIYRNSESFREIDFGLEGGFK